MALVVHIGSLCVQFFYRHHLKCEPKVCSQKKNMLKLAECKCLIFICDCDLAFIANFDLDTEKQSYNIEQNYCANATRITNKKI